MNDKSDLTKLQSITLALEVARGDENTVESNELIMRSMNELLMIDQIFLLWP